MTFLEPILEPTYRTQNLSNVTCFMHQAFFGKGEGSRRVFNHGFKTQLKFALNQFDLNNNFGSGTIANLSLEENVEWPKHWMPEGTHYTFLKDAWEAWLLA